MIQHVAHSDDQVPITLESKQDHQKVNWLFIIEGFTRYAEVEVFGN